jgi:predicted DsbA family dithiol-disulfide isomerase
MTGASGPFPIDFIGDVVCPWCFLGWTRLKAALALRPALDAEVLWRPYQLQFDIPEAGLPYGEFMDRLFPDRARRREMDERLTEMGKAEGLDFDLAAIAVRPNTNAAHRLIRWAGPAAGPVAEAVMRAHFTQGRNIGDPEVLAAVAGEQGLDAGEALAYLRSGRDREVVDEECRMASQAGVNGVPFMVLANRIAVSGAETPDRLVYAIDKAIEVQQNAAK